MILLEWKVLLDLHANKAKKYLPVTNALAYFAVASPTPTKRCTTSTSARPLERQFRHVDAAQTAKARQICTHRPGTNIIKLFSVIYKFLNKLEC